jgi:fatty-acyl-CoA synthase
MTMPAEAQAQPTGEAIAGSKWDHTTVGQALDQAVTRWGDRELLVFSHRRLTTRTLAEEAAQFARGLLRMGMHPGDHVAVWLPNLPELCVVELAVAKLGGAMVAINTRYKSSELEYVLRQSDATTLVMLPQLGKIDFLATLQQVIPELGNSRAGELQSSAAPRLRSIVVLGEGRPGMLAYDDVLRLGDDPALWRELREREARVRPDDTVLLQYTSGTTRFPKAVMLGHAQVLRNAAQMAARAGIDESDRVLSAMPMFHVGGSVCALLGAVTTGFTVFMSPVFDSAETLETIEKEQITSYVGLESMFLALRNHEDFARRSRASLKKGWTAGTASILRMVAEEIGIRSICPVYGLSEASPNVCIADWRDPYQKRINTMGRPQPGLEVKVVGPASDKPLPPGEAGEICVRGYAAMKGYYKDPEATAAVIDKDGWLHTGDIGFLDSDGFLTWTGRLKDMLKVGGENISAVEVEDLICSHEAVHAAVVVGVPDDRLGEVPFAFVQLKADVSTTAEELSEHCRRKVSGFKVPRYIRFVSQFEMTGSGKIQKFLMRKLAVAEVEKQKTEG